MLLDETLDGLRSMFDSAAQRTAGAVESSRSLMERTRIRQQLNEAYRKLGKAEYEAAIGGVNSMDEISGLMAQITELRQNMLSLERNVTQGSSVSCPSCGRQNAGDAAFCSACGARLRG